MERLDEGAAAVEFSDEDGRTFVLLAIPADHLLPLHRQQETPASPIPLTGAIARPEPPPATVPQ